MSPLKKLGGRGLEGILDFRSVDGGLTSAYTRDCWRVQSYIMAAVCAEASRSPRRKGVDNPGSSTERDRSGSAGPWKKGTDSLGALPRCCEGPLHCTVLLLLLPLCHYYSYLTPLMDRSIVIGAPGAYSNGQGRR